MKCVLRAWGQLKRGFEVLAVGEMCIEVVALGEMCFASMGAVEKGV